MSIKQFKDDLASAVSHLNLFVALTPITDGFSLGFNGDYTPFTLTAVPTLEEKPLRGKKVYRLSFEGTRDHYQAIPKADGSGYEYGEEIPFAYTTDKEGKPSKYRCEVTVDEQAETVVRCTKIGLINNETGRMVWHKIHTTPIPFRKYRTNPHF